MESDLLVCQEIFKQYSRTYYYSAYCFPRPVRWRVCALYAFFRLPDEIVDHIDRDNRERGEDPRRELGAFREAFERAWASGHSEHPVLRAFCATARRFGIRKEWADAFLDSMALDLTVTCYETYDDLRHYVYGSAEVVGLMMAAVLGAPPEGFPAARDLGLAMQLTNFYRDIGEDWDRGRIYVPLEDLDRFGIDRREWNSQVDPVKFNGLLRFQAERNWEIYKDAHAGLAYIPRHSRLAVALSSSGYQRTLQRITRDPMAVWNARVSKTKCDYLPILYRAWNAAYAH